MEQDTRPSSRELHPAGKEGHQPDLVIDASGLDEVSVVPWPLMLRHRVVSRVEASHRYPWLILWTALFGLFTVGFTVTLLAVSIPTIADDLGASQSTLAWVITGPLLAYAVVGPTLGKAGDLWGYKRVYLIGLAGAGVFAGCVAFAWDAPSLILFRVLGAGIGAATGPASMAMLNRVFEPEERVKALGYWSFVSAGAPVLGVVVGAPVVEAFGWRWVFAAQVPLCLIGFVVALAILPETERQKGVRFDIPGAVLLAVSITSLLFGLNRGAAWGWSNTVVIVTLALCPITMAAFIAYERRASDPLLPLAYFKERNFAAPIAVQFFTNFAYMGGFILTPLLLADGLGYGTTKVGLLSIFRPLAFALDRSRRGVPLRAVRHQEDGRRGLALRIGLDGGALRGGGGLDLRVHHLRAGAVGHRARRVVARDGGHDRERRRRGRLRRGGCDATARRASRCRRGHPDHADGAGVARRGRRSHRLVRGCLSGRRRCRRRWRGLRALHQAGIPPRLTAGRSSPSS